MNGSITVIGLCGRSGSGKGYVSRKFFERGIPFIDTDKLYRDKVLKSDNGMSPCLCEIVSEFGTGVLDVDGNLDRKKLAEVVFADGNEDKLIKLNDITHKYILEETLKLIGYYEREGYRAVIIDAPVLFESGFDKLCRVKICVTAPRDIAVERICLRDNRSPREAESRLDSQLPEGELIKLCDETVVNDGVTDLDERIGEIIEKYGF